MGGTVSLYLKDDTLRLLDAEVERQAAVDRANGLSGRRITNRSQLIERIVEEHLGQNRPLPLERIEYCVVSLAKKYKAEKVSLFGSYARNEATAASDVDILLEKGQIRGLQVLDFQDELAEKLGKQVDVVTTAGASKNFLDKIREDEVVLYEAVRA